MLERFDSPFPGGPFETGEDPHGRKSRVERHLRQLSYANIDVKIGDEIKKSSALFEAGDHADVLAYFWSKEPVSADDFNDLGCAHAWDGSWADATTRLTASKNVGAATDDQKKRADGNLALVAQAEMAANS